MKNRKRILIGKIGLDGHDNGIRIVSKWMADAGFEVVRPQDLGLAANRQRDCRQQRECDGFHGV